MSMVIARLSGNSPDAPPDLMDLPLWAAASLDRNAVRDGATSPRSGKSRRGKQAYFSGLAAEESIARDYERRGCRIIGRRVRTPYGEIDLIARDGIYLVFIEVKKRKHQTGTDSPINNRQWQRLASAALHCMVGVFDVTRVQPCCRFDVALVDGKGKYNIIENARTFDEH